MNLLLSALIIGGVALITGLIVYFRFDEVAAEPDMDEDQKAKLRPIFTFGTTMAAVVFGVVVAVGFSWADGRWPDSAQTTLLGLALGLMILLSIAAAIVRPMENLGGVREVIVLNIVWGLGYGALLPMVIA